MYTILPVFTQNLHLYTIHWLFQYGLNYILCICVINQQWVRELHCCRYMYTMNHQNDGGKKSCFHFLAAMPVKISSGPVKLWSAGEVGHCGKNVMLDSSMFMRSDLNGYSEDLRTKHCVPQKCARCIHCLFAQAEEACCLLSVFLYKMA